MCTGFPCILIHNPGILMICSAGDCLVQGFNPPENAVVIQDSVPGDATDQKGGIPLLRAPRGYERVFQDEQSRNDRQLSIWKPVPMPGSVLFTSLCTPADAC